MGKSKKNTNKSLNYNNLIFFYTTLHIAHHKLNQKTFNK